MVLKFDLRVSTALETKGPLLRDSEEIFTKPVSQGDGLFEGLSLWQA
jgi:hypothetical protein